MRRILRERNIYSFTVTIPQKMRKLIIQKMFEMNHLQKASFYYYYENLFTSLFIKQKQQHKKIQKYSHEMRLNNLLTSNPVENILDHFQEVSYQYNEQYLVEVVQNLSRAIQINHLDNWASFDKDSYKLHLLPKFDHLVEEIKYSLGTTVYISFDSISKIITALGQMQYVDDQIIRLVLDKIDRTVGTYTRNEQQRLFQAQKRGYHLKSMLENYNHIIKDQKLQRSLKIAEQKLQKYTKLDKEMDELNIFNKFMDKNAIKDLNLTIRSLGNNVQTLVEAIIALRRQYRKMKKASSLQTIYANPQLNYSLLELEQQLVLAGFIDYNDIKHDPHINQQSIKIGNILGSILKQEYMPYLSHHIELQSKKTQQVDYSQIEGISNLYLKLAQYANLPYRVYHNPLGTSLISIHWQQLIINEPVSQHHKINAERIYRKPFKDVITNILKNFNLLEIMLMKVPLSKKIKLIDALCNIGMHQQAITLTAIQNWVHPQQYSLDQLISLASVLTNIGDNLITLNDYDNVKKHICEKLTNNIAKLSIKQLIKLINFLSLRCNASSQFSDSYKSLLDELTNKVQYRLNNPYYYQQLLEPFRILSLERPTLFFLKTFQHYLNRNRQPGYIQNKFNSEQLDKSPNYNLKNPFKQPIQSVCSQYLNTSIDTLGIMCNGFKSPACNTQLGLYIASSQQTSIDGKYINGNLQAYFYRILKYRLTQLKYISINQFLDINYQNNQIKLKSDQEVSSILSFKLYQNYRNLPKLLNNIRNAIQSIVIDNKLLQNKITYQRLLQSIKILYHYSRAQKQTVVFEHYLAIRTKIITHLHLFKQDFNHLSTQTIHQMYQKLYGKQLVMAIDEVIKEYAQGLKQVSPKPQTQFFEGRRQTIQLINQPNNNTNIGNINVELINSTHYHDKSYVEYGDWESILSKSTNYHAISLDNASKTTNLLAKVFCPQIKQYIHIIPQPYNKAYFNTPYPSNWETIYTKNLSDQQIKQENILINNIKHESTLQPLNEDIKKIITLQNFKHELKLSKNINKICDYILGFSFIQKLIQEKLSNKTLQSNGKLLPRDPKSYFNYLYHKNDKIYLQSPYMEYILNKMNHIESIKDAIQQRSIDRQKNRINFMHGRVNREQYLQINQRIDSKLLVKVQQLHKKTLDATSDMISQPGLKIVHLKKDFEEFSKLFNRINQYLPQFDEDFIKAKGDYSEALRLKRQTVEHNLIKFYIIKKIAIKKQLTEKQNLYILQWKKNLLQPNSPSNGTFTKLSLNDITQSDKSKLILHHTNLAKLTDLSLNQLVLQFNHFLDQNIIMEVQRNIKSYDFSKNLQIPLTLFSFSSNKEFTELSLKKQKQIFDNNQKLNEIDINDLKNMISILKVQSTFTNQIFQKQFQNIHLQLQTLNSCPQRVQLISEYISKKQNQFNNNYDAKQIENKKNLQITKIFTSVFNKKYQSITQKQLFKVCQQICRRLYIIRKNIPPYFGSFLMYILAHPSIDQLSKQNLISNLQHYKIPLVFDSNDIMFMGKYCQNKLAKIPKFDIIKEMKIINGKNFSKQISSKLLLN